MVKGMEFHQSEPVPLVSPGCKFDLAFLPLFLKFFFKLELFILELLNPFILFLNLFFKYFPLFLIFSFLHFLFFLEFIKGFFPLFGPLIDLLSVFLQGLIGERLLRALVEGLIVLGI